MTTKFTDEQRVNHDHPHPGDVFYIRSHLFNYLTLYRLETGLLLSWCTSRYQVFLSSVSVQQPRRKCSSTVQSLFVMLLTSSWSQYFDAFLAQPWRSLDKQGQYQSLPITTPAQHAHTVCKYFSLHPQRLDNDGDATTHSIPGIIDETTYDHDASPSVEKVCIFLLYTRTVLTTMAMPLPTVLQHRR